MNKLFSPIKAVFSLGWLGLVILLMAGAIVGSIFSQDTRIFKAAQERVVVLDWLEYDVQQSLNEMKLAEARQIFALRYNQLSGQTDYAKQAEESNAKIDEILQSLEPSLIPNEDAFVSDVSESLNDFNDLRATHRETFNQIIQAYQAEDTEKAGDLIETLQDENDMLDNALRSLVRGVELDRVHAYRAFTEQITKAIYIATGGLIATLLLALVGYQLISSAVRPLKHLRNMVTAMEGDQYRPEMQAELLKKGGPAGELARALDQLARGIQQQDAGLKMEVERLRQALYESRRRRLKVFHESNNGSEHS